MSQCGVCGMFGPLGFTEKEANIYCIVPTEAKYHILYESVSYDDAKRVLKENSRWRDCLIITKQQAIIAYNNRFFKNFCKSSEANIFFSFKSENEVYDNVPYTDIKTDYACPHCGASNDWDDYPYMIDDEEWPKIINRKAGINVNGDYDNWTEVHKCVECRKLFKISNGAY